MFRRCTRERETHLFDLHAVSVFEVGGLEQDQEVEVPGPAKIRHEDGIARHRRKEGLPRGVGHSGRDVVLVGASQRVFDVEQLLPLDRGMVGWFLEDQPQPRQVPQETHDSVEVKRRQGT